MLNSVLTNKVKQCKGVGISLQINLQGYQKGVIKALDQVLLVNELIAYALENCQKECATMQRRELWLSGKTVAGYLVMKVTNADGTNAKLLSKAIAKNPEMLQNSETVTGLKALVKLYQGKLEEKTQDGWFEIVVQLKG